MAGKTPSDVGFVNRGTALLRTGELFDILICSALWLVKLSFLMFFQQLGSNSRGRWLGGGVFWFLPSSRGLRVLPISNMNFY